MTDWERATYQMIPLQTPGVMPHDIWVRPSAIDVVIDMADDTTVIGLRSGEEYRVVQSYQEVLKALLG